MTAVPDPDGPATGVVERDGQVVFVREPPPRLERLAWGVLWVAGPIVAVSSVIDAINGDRVLLSIGTAAFIVGGGILRVRVNLRRKRDRHALDPIPLPPELLDEVRELYATGQGTQAMTRIREQAGLGLGDASLVIRYAREHADADADVSPTDRDATARDEPPAR